ncbi:MAG: hypothetical protein IJY16_03605, partial [Clostridia bacterium]|nr:hypothetical protein [Clostridia bacterium]
FLPKQLWWLLPSAVFVLLVFFIALYESFERLGRILAIVLALLCLIASFSLGVIPAALCALKILKSTFR